MKKKLLLTCIGPMCFTLLLQAQTNASLDINKVKAMVNSNGDLFWDHTSAQYEVPAGSGINAIFAGSMWIGSLDNGGTLHMAAQTYKQTGTDFFQGPVSNASQYNSSFDAQWDKVWKISKTMIDSFRLGLYGSNIPSVIQTWPGNGNTSIGQQPQLAPYVDVNADGVYDYQAGDYPCIKGDQAIYFLFNDDRGTHTETNGLKLRIEVHAMLYAYKSPGTALDSAVFLNYKIYNLNQLNYPTAYLGNWTDFDLGSPGDDYVGCDVGRGMFYAYNGTASDGSGGPGTYGSNPPAIGVMMLIGPEADTADGTDNNHDGNIDEAGEKWTMSHFVYYVNNFGATGNPSLPGHHFNYLSGKWKDSTYVTYGGNGYGGSTTASYMFPGTSDPIGWGTNFVPQAPWDEVTSGNLPSDRRGLGGYGPFEFRSGEELCIDYAYVFGRGTFGPASSVARMQVNADTIRNFYAGINSCTCSAWPVGIADQSNSIKNIGLYPNPVSDLLTVDFDASGRNVRYEVISLTGQLVNQGVFSGNRQVIDVSKLPKSVYYLKIFDESTVAIGRFVRQ